MGIPRSEDNTKRGAAIFAGVARTTGYPAASEDPKRVRHSNRIVSLVILRTLCTHALRYTETRSCNRALCATSDGVHGIELGHLHGAYIARVKNINILDEKSRKNRDEAERQFSTVVFLRK